MRTKFHARILREKGGQKKTPNMFTVGSSTSPTLVRPARHGTCVALQTKGMETDKLKHTQKSADAYPSGGTKFMRLENSTKHNTRLGQPRITRPRPFFVAGAGCKKYEPEFKYSKYIWSVHRRCVFVVLAWKTIGDDLKRIPL